MTQALTALSPLFPSYHCCTTSTPCSQAPTPALSQIKLCGAEPIRTGCLWEGQTNCRASQELKLTHEGGGGVEGRLWQGPQRSQVVAGRE